MQKKKTKLKAVIMVLMLVCLSSMTALAKSPECGHSYVQVGVDVKDNWTQTHYVAGPSGVETCTIGHQEVRYYFQCTKCGDQFTRDETITRHYNSHCPNH